MHQVKHLTRQERVREETCQGTGRLNKDPAAHRIGGALRLECEE